MTNITAVMHAALLLDCFTKIDFAASCVHEVCSWMRKKNTAGYLLTLTGNFLPVSFAWADKIHRFYQ
jgi:hypothetical protein